MESSIISKIVSTKTLKVHRAENEEFKEKPEIIGLIGLKELVAKNPLILSLQCWMNIYHRKYQIRPSHWSQKSEKYIAFSDNPEFLKSILNKQKPIFPPFLVVFSQFLMLCFHEKGFSHIWAIEPEATRAFSEVDWLLTKVFIFLFVVAKPQSCGLNS